MVFELGCGGIQGYGPLSMGQRKRTSNACEKSGRSLAYEAH